MHCESVQHIRDRSYMTSTKISIFTHISRFPQHPSGHYKSWRIFDLNNVWNELNQLHRWEVGVYKETFPEHAMNHEEAKKAPETHCDKWNDHFGLGIHLYIWYIFYTFVQRFVCIVIWVVVTMSYQYCQCITKQFLRCTRCIIKSNH